MPRIDIIEAGFYRMKLVRNGPWVPVKVWFGQPPDPDHPGELLDRSLRWQCEVDGLEADVDQVWPIVAGRQIDENEYRYLIAVVHHAKTWDPQYPESTPEQAIDLLKVKPPF